MPQLITKTARLVIDKALSQVGVHEGRSNGHWNNNQRYSDETPGLEWSDFQAWCATFVAWCALKAGVAELYPRTASCDVAAAWFKERHQWSEFPAIGAQMFLGTPADLNHTGIVIDFDATTITTIEGNTNDDGSREGDGVYRKVRPRSQPVGYGYPAFPEGIVSADPAWAKRAPKPTKAPKPAKAPKPPRPKAPAFKDAEFTVATHNVGNGSVADVLAAILALFTDENTDVVGVQEVGDRAAVLHALIKLGYSVYRGDGSPGSDKLAIIWRPSADLVAKAFGTEKVGDRTDTNEPQAAGPEVMENKYIVWVRFHHARTGRAVLVAVTHVAPSIYLPGHYKLAKRHLALAGEWLAERRTVVFLLGDFNMRPTNRLTKPLRAAGYTSNHAVLGWLRTHTLRTIDMIWTKADDARVKMLRHRTVKTTSDHRAVVVTSLLRAVKAATRR